MKKVFKQNGYKIIIEKMNLQSHSQIRRTMTISGVSIPAFIHNGMYYKTNLDVFQDGIIDAWGIVDIDFFKQKIENGWIQPSVPDGEDLSIFHLGQFTVKNGKWQFDSVGFQQYVLDIIKELKPKQENLYSFYGTDVRIKSNVRYAKNVGTTAPIFEKKRDEYQNDILKGDKYSIFKRIEDHTYYLCRFDIFPDSTIRINDLPNAEYLSFAELKDRAGKDFISEIQEGDKVIIHGLGEMEVEKTFWQNEINDMVGDIADKISILNRQPDSSDVCKAIYEDYLKHPFPELKEKLKIAYEAIPSHLRMYMFGDMDLRDTPVTDIIY